MKMKTIKCEKRLCTCCMEVHEVKTVITRDIATFKEQKVEYDAEYMYCDIAGELYADERQMLENDIRLKDAYRREEGLLTASDITDIRGKYGITQSDLCSLLGWGGKTITRYESHQVQDRAHDTILKKLDSDPEWFISLLNGAKETIAEDAYRRYLKYATLLYEADRDIYLRKAIEADYVRFKGDSLSQGNTELSLDKVVDVIRYFSASSDVTSLYKVKLMKLMWYADSLSYKRRGHAITGLAYQALPMGAVPVGHNSIIDLKDVPCEEIDMGEGIAYHFSLSGEGLEFGSLSDEDIAILNTVIQKLGKMTKDEIVSFMHKERAYMETPPKDTIQFRYSDSLQI